MTTEGEIVLIVDDEAAVRRVLKKRLSAEGYRCEEAANADQALQKFVDTEVPLAILDIRMPGKSGAELLAEIKQRYQDTAIIMATAVSDTSVAIQCMKDGAYDYIAKPFNLDEVIVSVERALEKRKMALENREYQHKLEEKVEAQAIRIRASFMSAIAALANALEAKDNYTSGHSQRVAATSAAVAQELGVPEGDVERIRLAGLVHDIGKIGVSEAILNKPSGLTREEFGQVQDHCTIGEHILQPVAEDEELLRLVRHHHERYDGGGYPDRLAGVAIPLGARILAVTDSYDAMTSRRPYRGAMSPEKALAEIERSSAAQFDPTVVQAFLKISAVETARIAAPSLSRSCRPALARSPASSHPL